MSMISLRICKADEEVVFGKIICNSLTAISHYYQIYGRPQLLRSEINSTGKLNTYSELLCVVAIPSYVKPETLFFDLEEFRDRILNAICISNSQHPYKYTLVLSLKSKAATDELCNKNSIFRSSKFPGIILKMIKLEAFTIDSSLLDNLQNHGDFEEITHLLENLDISKQENEEARDTYVQEITNSGVSQSKKVENKYSLTTELPTCPLCLDRFNSITLGNAFEKNSENLSDISIWKGSNCRVCMYVQEGRWGGTWGYPLHCAACNIAHNLWICMLCDHIGCGRYTAEHAKVHHATTGHPYSLELSTGRIWDYSGDRYVHRIIEGCDSRTDRHYDFDDINDGANGKFWDHSDLYEESDSCSKNALQEGRRKCKAVAREYDILLASQLDEQQNYYESLISHIIAEGAQKNSEEEQFSKDDRKQVLQLQSEVKDLEQRSNTLIADLRSEQERLRDVHAKNAEMIRAQREIKNEVAFLKKSASEERAVGEDLVSKLEQEVSNLSFHIRTRAELRLKSELEGGQLVLSTTEEVDNNRASTLRKRLQQKLYEKQQRRTSK